ncbi:MAG: response regulator [Pleurocapsa sp.]
MNATQTVKNILLIEDAPSYQDLMWIAFEEHQINHNLHIVSNATEALNFLRRTRPYINVPSVDLIILDLDLPGMHGHELLAIIKQDLCFKLIPVIVFTSSTNTQDILTSYRLKANCYLNKPLKLENFFLAVKKTLEFWLNFTQIPG